jgi:uncharacterized protein
MENMPKNIVIYHKHCPDGSTAAAIAYKKFGEAALYFPCSYGDELPVELTEHPDKKNTDVYILDFSFSSGVLAQIDNDFKSLVVLDHHISAKDAVESVKGRVFNNQMSGASLAWQYFMGTDIPEFVSIIESIDIHKDGYEELKAIDSYISSVDFSIEKYVALLETYDENKDNYLVQGEAISRYIDKLEQGLTRDFDVVEFDGIKMPAINMTFDINTKSRILTALYGIMPPVAMSYRYSNGSWKISLRSDRTLDVSKIAAKYGGGGHAGAAGIEIPAPDGKIFFTPLGKWSELKDTL